jgi:hypothetical protein
VGISVLGSAPYDLSGWRRVGRLYSQSAGAVVPIAATTTVTVASQGLVLKWLPGQAIFIRRFVAGVSAAAAANNIIYYHGSLEVQAGAQPFTVSSGQVSNDTEMLAGDPSPSVANAQTLSDMSMAFTLRDDWYEYNDYQEIEKSGVGGLGLGLMGFWRLRNASAGALNVNTLDSCLYETWEPMGLEGRLA